MPINDHQNRIFLAIAEPTRRHIIEMLAQSGHLSATAIAEKFKISPPAISQHLKVLRNSGLVQMTKSGQQRIYQINPKAMTDIEKWVSHITQQWQQRFDRLDLVLKAEKEKMIKRLK